jgi:hypothetical protein
MAASAAGRYQEADRKLASCFLPQKFLIYACSQGGVKIPTGGIRSDPGARERFRHAEGQQTR